MKNLKKVISLLLALIISLCFMSITALVSSAQSPVIDYDFGEEWRGSVSYVHDGQNFKINLSVKSHIHIKFKSEEGSEHIKINIIDSSDQTVFDDSLTVQSYNSNSKICFYEYSCNLKAGSYTVNVTDWSSGSTRLISSFFIFSEPVVSLSTPVISSVSSPSGGKLKAACGNVTNALTYELQYSTNSSFKSAKTKSSPTPKIEVSGLKKGVYYYVRIRACTVYNDGLKVYSNWSRAQSVYVKKLNNSVSISTSSKRISYSTLQSKNVSFIVAAQDKAGVSFKFSISEIPGKLKGKISINASTGSITVKKGAPKGSYSVKVTVNAAATNNYNKASVSKIIKITIS